MAGRREGRDDRDDHCDGAGNNGSGDRMRADAPYHAPPSRVPTTITAIVAAAAAVLAAQVAQVDEMLLVLHVLDVVLGVTLPGMLTVAGLCGVAVPGMLGVAGLCGLTWVVRLLGMG